MEKRHIYRSVKTVRACPCFVFPQGSMESPDLLQGFCLGQQNLVLSSNCLPFTQDMSHPFLSHPAGSWGFSQGGKTGVSMHALLWPLAPCCWLSLAGEPGGDSGTGLCSGGLGRVCTRAGARTPSCILRCWGEAPPAPAPLTAASCLVMQAAGHISFNPAASCLLFLLLCLLITRADWVS